MHIFEGKKRVRKNKSYVPEEKYKMDLYRELQDSKSDSDLLVRDYNKC